MVENRMRIIYHIPSLDTVYAARTIYYGYKNAFVDLGHDFKTVTCNDNLKKILEKFQPDIFISSISNYSLKFLDVESFNKARLNGMIAFMSTNFWNSPLSRIRINEGHSLKNEKNKVKAIKKNLLGDVFFNQCEQDDLRMAGFEEETGFRYYTIPLAADKIALKEEFDNKYESDISFIGTYLPQKRDFFRKHVFPLRRKYNLKIYGQDWTWHDRALGWIQRGGQYFNFPYMRSIRKPKLQLQDESKIYKSSIISLNVHEDYQREFGGDCNERTFKIPLCSGFEITDDVACIRKYFKADKEIIIANNREDWFEKIDYYMNNPDKRLAIIEAGRERVLKEHTYHNRSEQIIKIYEKLKKHG
ncbi:MAG: glycosyltransferase [Candidatus Methanoperedens sp.]|nr:glycosyltransferase [Candidatus Methanoperedens sp.]